MKLILLLPAAGLALAGLVHNARTLVPVLLSEPTVETNTTDPVANQGQAMWSETETVRRRETFTLHFAVPHPSFLGVTDPDGRFYYLVFPAELSAGHLKPLVSSEQFQEMTSITIDPARLTADPFTYGVWENRPVFTQKGRYTFILGDNLHVHDPAGLILTTIDWVD